MEKAIIYTGTQGSYYGATTEMVSNAQGKWWGDKIIIFR
jgi:hypothetical protein